MSKIGRKRNTESPRNGRKCLHHETIFHQKLLEQAEELLEEKN